RFTTAGGLRQIERRFIGGGWRRCFGWRQGQGRCRAGRQRRRQGRGVGGHGRRRRRGKRRRRVCRFERANRQGEGWRGSRRGPGAGRQEPFVKTPQRQRGETAEERNRARQAEGGDRKQKQLAAAQPDFAANAPVRAAPAQAKLEQRQQE